MIDQPAATASPAAASTESPSPVASAAACDVPNARPRVLQLVKPTYTRYMEENHKAGVVDVLVYIDDHGIVVKAEIYHSAGDVYLDGATYDAAVATKYAPEIKNCVPVAGKYIYRTRYSATPLATPSASPTAPLPAASAEPTPAVFPTLPPRAFPTE